VHVGENAGDCQRVGYVVFTTAPQLAEMCLFGEVVGALYVVGLVGAKVAPEGVV